MIVYILRGLICAVICNLMDGNEHGLKEEDREDATSALQSAKPATRAWRQRPQVHDGSPTLSAWAFIAKPKV